MYRRTRQILAFSLALHCADAFPHKRYTNSTLAQPYADTSCVTSTSGSQSLEGPASASSWQSTQEAATSQVPNHSTPDAVTVNVQAVPTTTSAVSTAPGGNVSTNSTQGPFSASQAVDISLSSQSSTGETSTSSLTNDLQCSTFNGSTSSNLTLSSSFESSTISEALPATTVSVTASQGSFHLPAVTPSVLAPLSTVEVTNVITDFVTVCTSLETAGRVSLGPLISFSSSEAIPTATLTKTLKQNGSVTINSTQVAQTDLAGIDPFQAIGTNAPPGQLPTKHHHPVPTANIVAPQKATLQTNKFYANLFLGSHDQSVFTLPYTLNWVNGSGGTKCYGMAIQQSDGAAAVNGPAQNDIPQKPVSYYTHPLNMQQIVLSAKELAASGVMTARSLDTFSVDVDLTPATISRRDGQDAASSKLTLPLVQGMGFVTGIYTNMRPQIQTGGAFTNVTSMGSVGTAYKYQVSLNDGTKWLFYAIPDDKTKPVQFNLSTNAVIQGPDAWSGVIQVAKNPALSRGESVYDLSAGVYPTGASLSGAVNGTQGQYSLDWNVTGRNNNSNVALGFALPHMRETFSDSMNSSIREGLSMSTPTKGKAVAVTSNKWTMIEPHLPTDMSFTPWTPSAGTTKSYSADAVNAIYAAAQSELSENMEAQTDSNSMYYAGKAFSKFASILIAVNDICQETGLAQQGVERLEAAFAKFVNNSQMHPLAYDDVWKGVVSTASYGGDAGADFGNTYYNDHHFHYGYFLHAAAVLAHLDPAWLSRGTNKDWVDSLARDVSNPSADDAYFPVFRYFDWYQGHSWAHGLFETADGKDEESSSEDVMFSYGLKLWGMVTGDRSMEARGNLMLAVQARSLQSYFLLESDNKNQPADFVPNKVTGILFENKVDHTTYFGNNPAYTQGIQMIPLTPASALTRKSSFVQQEWDTYFAANSTAPADRVSGGWRGILYANLALWQPKTSYRFFAGADFDAAWLDGGASRTWYLAFAAGMGGA